MIDISGDGSNNRGRPVTQARDDAVRAGVVINGLPILALEPWLDKYYFENVIGGPGSFMIPAESYEKFADAVLRKLVLEIASNCVEDAPSLHPDLQRHRPLVRAVHHAGIGIRQAAAVGALDAVDQQCGLHRDDDDEPES